MKQLELKLPPVAVTALYAATIAIAQTEGLLTDNPNHHP